ncbi:MULTISPECIES: DUF1501 domain-containing protein [unclassified Moorena]|uniref:DUF1501 domain-containing protein n=2 Tax=Moorena TaxID=1155738 RepID=UPI0013FEB970|nr:MULTISPECIES: DUF1501 domain-containing protein [unclassified Moorena]NEO13692.1 DUF1501 domain-containing protein [Moorena sp. SIO3E8]NEP98358.1 DUF1501 domain-containing protein [Moorena sp. SIO3F7]
MKRRKLLQQASLLTAGGIISMGSWVARGLANTANTNHRKRLIVIFLRGGIDGLNVVVPYQEADYYQARPRIAIPRTGEKGGVLDLDGYFGLHPALADLMPLWKQKSLAFVHASGSPDSTRSHFDAQDYMESGTPGIKSTDDGWMNRLLGTIPKEIPTQAVNMGTTTPRILSGQMPVANLPMGRNYNHKLPVDRPQIDAAFDQLYRGNNAINLAYQEGSEARKILLAELKEEMMAANRGAPPSSKFVGDSRKLAKLMVGDAKTQLAFLALGGWDTHVNQGGSQGQLARKLKPIGQGLATLVKALEPIYANTVIVVMSEFGRTLAENGNKGTDHGHGNVMWVLGGGVRGGKVYGEWPGLAESQLYEKRDLAVTTDFREVLMPVLREHMEIGDSNLAQIFPGFTSNQSLGLL